jgi:CheY-like chemotaxis protein
MHKLLVVDDDDALRRLMRLELGDAYDVIDSGEPEQGLALAMEHRPSAILLDLRMPKYSGYELCQALATFSHTQMIPIIIVSGEAGAQTVERCKQLGAANYFEKPVDLEALRACLRQVVKAREPAPLSEVQVKLHVGLKLAGVDRRGKSFREVATTESVSLCSFLCSCAVDLPVNSIIDVGLTAAGGTHVGRAQIARSEEGPTGTRRYSCRFMEKTGPWVIQ